MPNLPQGATANGSRRRVLVVQRGVVVALAGGAAGLAVSHCQQVVVAPGVAILCYRLASQPFGQGGVLMPFDKVKNLPGFKLGQVATQAVIFDVALQYVARNGGSIDTLPLLMAGGFQRRVHGTITGLGIRANGKAQGGRSEPAGCAAEKEKVAHGNGLQGR